MNGGLGILVRPVKIFRENAELLFFFPFRGATHPDSAHEQGERRLVREPRLASL